VLAQEPKKEIKADSTKKEKSKKKKDLPPVFRTFLTDRSKTWNGIKLGVFFIQIRWLGVSWESVYP
jgi:hypothetical protein